MEDNGFVSYGAFKRKGLIHLYVLCMFETGIMFTECDCHFNFHCFAVSNSVVLVRSLCLENRFSSGWWVDAGERGQMGNSGNSCGS